MDDTFDPYLKWLGIRSTERPPNHYALLGLSLFEDDPEVVSNAADRQMSHVRTYQVGPHSHWSQRLLNELAVAKLCLLRADRKATYDAQLGEQFAAAEADAAAQVAAAQRFVAQQAPVATPVATPVELPYTTNFIEPPVDYAAPPQPPAPAQWHAPAAEPPLAPPAISLDFAERFAMPPIAKTHYHPEYGHPEHGDSAAAAHEPAGGGNYVDGQESPAHEYAAPAINAYADGVGWTEPIAYEPAYAVDPPAYGDSPAEPPFAGVESAGEATRDGLAAFTAARSTTMAARVRSNQRRRSSPMGLYVVLAGLLLAAVVLGKVVSDQRQAYDREVAAQRAQEAAQRAAAAAPPSPNKWKRPPNRPRSVDVRLPRPSSQSPAHEGTAHEDRVPLREVGEPTSFDDSLLQEAERDQRQP